MGMNQPTMIGAVPGLMLIEDYVDVEGQHQLLNEIDGSPWLTGLKRRVQHYGWRYDYNTRSVDESLRLGPLPRWAQALAERVVQDGLVPEVPDQLIVNEYHPGQGIAAHVDCVPCFGGTIASLSLGSPCVMDFIHATSADQVPVSLLPGSLVVMSGPARYEWKHRIAARKSDRVGGQVIPRGRRVSLTFRTVLADRG
jgi:alkylated DNA repair dioxygenase AlkB